MNDLGWGTYGEITPSSDSQSISSSSLAQAGADREYVSLTGAGAHSCSDVTEPFEYTLSSYPEPAYPESCTLTIEREP